MPLVITHVALYWMLCAHHLPGRTSTMFTRKAIEAPPSDMLKKFSSSLSVFPCFGEMSYALTARRHVGIVPPVFLHRPAMVIASLVNILNDGLNRLKLRWPS
jgi:hypothetical protein